MKFQLCCPIREQFARRSEVGTNAGGLNGGRSDNPIGPREIVHKAHSKLQDFSVGSEPRRAEASLFVEQAGHGDQDSRSRRDIGLGFRSNHRLVDSR